ncbi:MAG TPA: chemotaxis protein CheA [Clostridiales bacterium]|nr:chemotaxis protein CheA [Clostridiales bacterium]
MEDTLRNAFYEEAEELFQEIEDCILKIDGIGATKDNIDSLFRYMHTLKGSSAAMGMTDMSELTHQLEDLLGMVREKKLEISRDMIDIMLQSLDELKIRVAKHKRDEAYEINTAQFAALINFCKSKETAGKHSETSIAAVGEAEKTNYVHSLGLEEKAYTIQIYLREDTLMKGARLYIVTDKLSKSGHIQRTSWDQSESAEIEGCQFELLYISSLSEKEIEDLVYSISDIEKVEVSEIQADTRIERQDKDKEELQSVIRVNIKKLDQLLRIVEELSVDKERLKQLMKKVGQKYSKDPDVKALSSLVQHIDFIGNEMQESVMATRMYTLDSIFNRFPRVIRDLSRKQGKEIELKVEGESTELDRSIMEKIIDPLNHIIRNSVDHGIELPDEREKAGKSRKGTIKLSAGQEQGHIYIRVEDDGRGINVQKVKKKAIEKGLIGQEQAQSMSDKEALELIFMPGFSTADKVTDVSGRGVGMNVVKENIERINGMIDIHNVEGQGVAITLKLPLTLAIIQSLLIRTKRHRFVLPLLSIIEIFKVKESEYDKKVKFVHGKEVMNWRGEILPVIRVSNLFDTNAPKTKSFVGIIIGLSTRKIILGVEEILGQQQVVIKSLEKFTGKGNVLGELKGVSGTVILGDGEFAYVLDVQTLLKDENFKGNDLKEPAD